jgi:hypothetical protein
MAEQLQRLFTGASGRQRSGQQCPSAASR